MGDVVDVCYRPPDQEDEVEKVFFRQLVKASRSQALVLTWNYNHPNICRRVSKGEHKQSRRFLGCIVDNFLRS